MNTLNGQHLRVLAMEFNSFSLMTKRNSTGHVIRTDGTLSDMVETLSEMMNFSYSYAPIIAPLIDNSPFAKGAIFYLLNDEVDFLLSTSIGTAARFRQVDYPTNWYFGPFGIMVPYPKKTIDLAASLKPLAYEVWILIVVSILAICICLRLMGVFNKSAQRDVEAVQHIGRIVPYVLGNLISQGQRVFPPRLAVRIAVGTWCCGCFFLVQIYSSTLTSHLMSPNQKPIVSSFYEIANTPGLKLVVDRGYGMDVILQNIESGHFKKLADMVRNDPELRCNTTKDCLNLVKRGNFVYGATLNGLKFILAEDLKNSSTCNYSILKEQVWNSAVFTALRKNSPYTEPISIGIMRLKAFGFIDLWASHYMPRSSKCMEINKRDPISRLSIGNLSSAFVILTTGYALSFLVFIFEKLYALIRCAHNVVVM